MPHRIPQLAIHKFGGAALADAAAIREVTGIIRDREGPLLVVVSALHGTTDLLVDLIATAEAGKTAKAVREARRFRSRHLAVAEALLPANRRRAIVSEIETASDDLEALVGALAVLHESSPRIRDHIVARGERLSALMVAAALSARRMKAVMVDPATVLVTDGPYGGASPNLPATRTAARSILTPLLAEGIIPVVPGFLGKAPDGGTATLGRGGSDLTATTLGAALRAANVTLWKDVPGLLTADPRVVPDARLLDLVHPTEAAELAYYGAKVLHPRALLPLAGTKIPLWVRPFGTPEAVGTEISTRRESDPPPVRSLAAVPGQALVTVAGSGILGVPGMSARTFGALQAAGISVSLIAQASSEYTIDFTVPTAAADEAVTVLRTTFRHEIQHGELEDVRARPDVAIVAVVGLRMAGHPGIAARVFDALETAEVNVVAIAQGSAEHNISIVVDQDNVTPALQRIHAAFQLGKAGGGRPRRRTGKDVILVGAGTIGRTVLELLLATPDRFSALRLVAVVDSRGMLFDPSGLEGDTLRAIIAAKIAGRSVASLPGGSAGTPRSALRDLAQRALIRPVVVDATADDTGEMLEHLADNGFDIVLANKRPLTGETAEWRALYATLERHGGRLRHEATVGAGLPTVLAVDQLIRTGDRISRLEGCLSGTLGVVLTALQEGTPFSRAVLEARQQGMTEPDPREDLGGIDVARKALILARMLGQRRELEEIDRESLVRRGRRGAVEAWLGALPRDDAWWARRAEQARAEGGVLRYVARVTPQKASVGLQLLPVTHPLGQLSGPANRLVITSERYRQPLVITGPGAGPAVTATGVLADLLALTGG
jgi:aspartokinase/homoserine dehydrogenase 1